MIAKRPDLPYREDERVMTKVKHARTADCVVAGFRWHKSGRVVGSLLLGLYDEAGTLHHVGVTASFTAARRRELLDEIAPYRADVARRAPLAGLVGRRRGGGGGAPAGRRPGAQSRWNAGRDLSFEPLAPDLVCEVAYDHLQGNRFRHATTFRSWRPERDPVPARTPSSRSWCPKSSTPCSAPDPIFGVSGVGRSARRASACRPLEPVSRRAARPDPARRPAALFAPCSAATRLGSPDCLAKWGGQGASPSPAASSRVAISSRGPRS